MSNEPNKPDGPIEPEIVDRLPNEIPGTGGDDPERPLALKRTHYYTKRFLAAMSEAELVNMVRDQIRIALLMLNEQLLKYIEEMELAAENGQREMLQNRIERVLTHAAQLAKDKHALLDALDYHPDAIATGADGKEHAIVPKTKIGKDQFESMFDKLNPFATKQDAAAEMGKSLIDNLVDPDIQKKVHDVIKEAADSAKKNLGRIDKPENVN